MAVVLQNSLGVVLGAVGLRPQPLSDAAFLQRIDQTATLQGIAR